jgi:hypothetical protein
MLVNLDYGLAAISALAGNQFYRRDATYRDVVDHVLHLLRRVLAHQNMQAEGRRAAGSRCLGP